MAPGRALHMKTIGRLQVGWNRPGVTQPGPTEGAADALLGDEERPPGRTGFARVIRRGALPLAAVALLGVGYGLWSWTHGPALPASHRASAYASARAVLSALAADRLPCRQVSWVSDGTVPGSLSPYADCSGASDGDTSIAVFTSHASALAYAHQMLSDAADLGPAAEVVGPNWVINTIPAYARKVAPAMGGKILTAATNSSSSPGAAYPGRAADAALCRTFNTDIGSGDTYDIEQALLTAAGTASPKLASDMQAAVNGTTLNQDIKAQVKVTMDCALVQAGVPPA